MSNALRKLAGKINDSDGDGLFQAKCLGPGTTGTLNIEVGGTAYTNVPALSSADSAPQSGCWVQDLGLGRWLVMGTTGLSRGATGIPAGVVADYIGTVAPDGWALFDGRTITNAMNNYPALWAACPAAWKSGVDIILKDARGRVAVGFNSGDALFSTMGQIGGSPHDIGIVNHQHYQGNHQHWTADHTHTAPDHTHASDHTHGTGYQDTNHYHSPNAGTDYLMRDSAYNTWYGADQTQRGLAITWSASTNWISHNHAHGTGGQSIGAYVTYMNATHGTGLNCAYMKATHGGDMATSTVIGGDISTSTVIGFNATTHSTTNNNFQPYIALTKMIKL